MWLGLKKKNYTDNGFSSPNTAYHPPSQKNFSLLSKLKSHHTLEQISTN